MLKYISIIFIVFSAMSSNAQEPLSLSDAILKVLENNYSIRIEQQNVAIAENNNSWGQAGLLPSLVLNVQSQNNVSNQQSDNLFFGGQLFPGFELNDQRSYGLTPAATINWTIFQGNKAIISKRRLEQLQAESEQNADIVIANSLQATILAYYVAVLEKDRLNAFQEQLTLSRDRYQYVETKYDIGSAVSSDLLLEENNYLTDSVNFLNQKMIYRNAIRNLNELMVSDDLNTDYQLTDGLNEDFGDYQYEDLESQMMSGNVDLRKIYTTQSILETQVRQNRADLFPTVSFNAGYRWNRNVSDLTSASYTGPNTEYQNPPEPLISKTGTYFANFTLSFNLFNGGQVNRAIKNSIINEDIGNLRIDQLKTSLQRDLIDAYERYETRRQLYGINARKAESAQTNLQLSEEKFKTGSINSFDFRVVQNNYLTAVTEEYQALYNLMDSRVELMRLTGGLMSTYQDSQDQ